MKFETRPGKAKFQPFDLVIKVETEQELNALVELCMLDTSVPETVEKLSQALPKAEIFRLLIQFMLGIKPLLIAEKNHD
jgi:hypothetical protein